VSESRETQDETTEPGVEEEVQADGSGLPLEPPESAAGRLGDQLQDAQDRYLRLAAEFDNFRKRVARERIELADRAQSALVARLLDVIDDLDRLAAQDISQTGTDVLHEALVLLDRKLRKELEAAGLTGIDPVGTAFDPSVHEAVSVLPAPDPAMDQQVSATFQTGYLFKGALVRPARVQVYSADA
jgi:molecular chaperone GrpE